MMLDEVLAYIHKVDWRGSVPGLSRIDTLLGLLGHPERHVKYIHVAGTNGKGSTCAMLASVLRAAGYKTGLYTSPYIFRFNERMQINGAPIPDDTLCALVEELRPLADRMADPPTEFELVTAIGLTWFAREACDIVVCEVGMGGEFDATNVIPAPEVAVITNIGDAHIEFLGSRQGIPPCSPTSVWTTPKCWGIRWRPSPPPRRASSSPAVMPSCTPVPPPYRRWWPCAAARQAHR